jgi:hypothetical protein
MPLINYFVYVGSALLLSLIGLNWWLPQPITEAFSNVADRPLIRIASLEHLPDRVVIDTSLPTIAPPTSGTKPEPWPEQIIADAKPVATPTTPSPAIDAPKKQNSAKRGAPKMPSAHRAAPKANIVIASNDKVSATPAKTGLSLLDNLKDGLEQTQARLTAGLEPLTAFVSKLRP